VTDKPVVVLVRPQLGENIGKAARAMLNFGLTEMRLVEPRDGWPNPAAGPAAAGADEVLERAISHSCRKRDIDAAKVDQLISGVQRQMETMGDEVTSARIGEAVMAGLKALDHVAYIRFASIYKDFSEPGDFAEIAERVEKEAAPPPGTPKLI